MVVNTETQNWSECREYVSMESPARGQLPLFLRNMERGGRRVGKMVSVGGWGGLASVCWSYDRTVCTVPSQPTFQHGWGGANRPPPLAEELWQLMVTIFSRVWSLRADTQWMAAPVPLWTALIEHWVKKTKTKQKKLIGRRRALVGDWEGLVKGTEDDGKRDWNVACMCEILKE